MYYTWTLLSVNLGVHFVLPQRYILILNMPQVLKKDQRGFLNTYTLSVCVCMCIHICIFVCSCVCMSVWMVSYVLPSEIYICQCSTYIIINSLVHLLFSWIKCHNFQTVLGFHIGYIYTFTSFFISSWLLHNLSYKVQSRIVLTGSEINMEYCWYTSGWSLLLLRHRKPLSKCLLWAMKIHFSYEIIGLSRFS